MNNTSKVTVFLSSFNHGKYLRESIDSVLNQTYKDFTLIIYDDGSMDDSWEIITSYDDSRIRPYRSEVNSHFAIDPRMPEIKNSEFVAMHHSDDIWEPDKLKLQVEYLENHPEIGAVFTHTLIIGEDGEPLKDRSHYFNDVYDQPNRTRFEWLNHFFYKGNALCHPSMVIRNSCYAECGKYNRSFFVLPDLDLWVRLCLKYEIHIIERKLVRFRVRSGEKNTSGDRIDTMVRWKFEHLQILNHYRKINDREEFLKIFPQTEKLNVPDGFDIKYALAMAALDEEARNSIKLFGLQLLFEIVNNSDHFKLVNSLHGFSLRDYYFLTGKHEIFSSTPKEFDFLLRRLLKFKIVQKLITVIKKYVQKHGNPDR